MKKILYAVSAVILSALMFGCGSTKKAEPAPSVQISTPKIKIERMDWQGASIGSEPPAWLEAVVNGDVNSVAKALGVDSSKYKVFVLNNSGKTLDFVKVWTEQVDAVSEVAGSMSRVVGQTVKAQLQGTDEEVSKAVEQAVTVASSVELIGLEKKAQYWVKTRRLKTGVTTPQSDADYETPIYTYYVVYVMENNVFDKSLKSAIERGISGNTDQSNVLKQIITSCLAKTLIPDVEVSK